MPTIIKIYSYNTDTEVNLKEYNKILIFFQLHFLCPREDVESTYNICPSKDVGSTQLLFIELLLLLLALNEPTNFKYTILA